MKFSRQGELGDLWRNAGLINVKEQPLVIDQAYSSFNDYWEPFTNGAGPGGAFVVSLSEDRRQQLEARAAKTQDYQDSIASFYRGKTVSIVVGSAVGGGFDTYGRLVGRHLGRFIPGNPTVIVQNIPGAGSNKAASYVALNASKDGTVIGAVQAIAVTQTLLSDQPVSRLQRPSTRRRSSAPPVKVRRCAIIRSCWSICSA